MKEKETGKMKNQNNTAQSAGKKSFLQKKNVEISFKRYAIDAMGAMALGLFASLLIGTIIKRWQRLRIQENWQRRLPDLVC